MIDKFLFKMSKNQFLIAFYFAHVIRQKYDF